jgi:hypothetical protein
MRTRLVTSAVAAILAGPKTDDHDRGKEEALNE